MDLFKRLVLAEIMKEMYLAGYHDGKAGNEPDVAFLEDVLKKTLEGTEFETR